MTVYVNGEAVKIFEGAKVRDAAFAYARMAEREEYYLLPAVQDGLGHEVAWEGELTEGAHLRVEWE